MARHHQFKLKSKTGVEITFSMQDSLIVDDLVVASGKTEAFRRRTGKDAGTDVPSRDIRDYLIKLGVVFPE